MVLLALMLAVSVVNFFSCDPDNADKDKDKDKEKEGEDEKEIITLTDGVLFGGGEWAVDIVTITTDDDGEETSSPFEYDELVYIDEDGTLVVSGEWNWTSFSFDNVGVSLDGYTKIKMDFKSVFPAADPSMGGMLLTLTENPAYNPTPEDEEDIVEGEVYNDDKHLVIELAHRGDGDGYKGNDPCGTWNGDRTEYVVEFDMPSGTAIQNIGIMPTASYTNWPDVLPGKLEITKIYFE